MIWVHAVEEMPRLGFQNTSLTQADATQMHETLTLSSNENTNPFLK